MTDPVSLGVAMNPVYAELQDAHNRAQLTGLSSMNKPTMKPRDGRNLAVGDTWYFNGTRHEIVKVSSGIYYSDVHTKADEIITVRNDYTYQVWE